jgi:hypothetical protein
MAHHHSSAHSFHRLAEAIAASKEHKDAHHGDHGAHKEHQALIPGFVWLFFFALLGLIGSAALVYYGLSQIARCVLGGAC